MLSTCNRIRELPALGATSKTCGVLSSGTYAVRFRAESAAKGLSDGRLADTHARTPLGEVPANEGFAFGGAIDLVWQAKSPAVGKSASKCIGKNALDVLADAA